MKEFYANTSGAHGVEGISVTRVQNVRRVVVWLALVSAVLVGLIWITALTLYRFVSVIDKDFVMDTYPGILLNAARDNVDISKAFSNNSMTKTFSKRHLAASLRCFSETGMWVYDPTPKHLPWNHYGEIALSICDVLHQQSKDGNVHGDLAEEIATKGDLASWTIREELKWVWQTDDSCRWQAFSRDDFCWMMGSDRHMMLVGDSLNHEIIWSFLNALLVGNKSTIDRSGPTKFVEGPYQVCDDILSPGKGFNVSYVRNDRLSDIAEANEGSWNFYEFPWIPLLQEQDIKELLLNRGAHYEEDIFYEQALRHAYTVLSSEFPDILVIYRNTQPGHVNCSTFTKPFSSYPTEFLSSYQWEDFEGQNELAKNLTEEFGYIYMDTAALLSLRPDGHLGAADCLHYCIPGPLDIVIEYLYNLMLTIQDLVVI